MKVIKFGGSSVGSARGLQNIKEIIEKQSDKVVVVVSALGGITDSLLECCELASNGSATYLERYEAIRERHTQAVEQSVPPKMQAEVYEGILRLLDEMGNILRGVSLIQDLSPKTTAAVVSYGERLSSLIVSAIFENAALVDARNLIKTEPYFQRHIVDFTLTNDLIVSHFSGHDSKITVMGGFISSDKTTGETTNLGRGGSDYTASVVAAALGAKVLEIFTDVDGFMTADPRVIDNAYVIDRLTFVEAMELCNFGAKVIYPPTIFPAYNSDIPIVVKNTYNPDCKGTYISKEVDCADSPGATKSIKGISSINDTALLTIRGLGMVGVIGVNYRIFKALAKNGISVFLVSQASSENTTSIGVRTNDADFASEVLAQEFATEMAMGEIDEVIVQKDLATVAIVGEGMRHTPGIAGKLFGTLGRNGINVIACAQGASETNISFVVKVESLRKSLNVIHDSFFLSEYQVLNLFIAGVGLVGNNLIEQICGQQRMLIEQNSLKINVVGISNSRKSIFNREGIELENYSSLIDEKGIPTTPDDVADEIVKMNIFNSVFVDCTASYEVSSIYERLLSNNISVVTANKIAASSSYEHYSMLKSTARARGVKFLFETNVGAGLPIINTINDLRNSGDKILGLKAVLSGTLNYIFNVISEEIPFSEAVLLAKQAGYAEPDPRLDLSGTDVIRKLVILSRESGYMVKQSNVEKNLFVPDEYFEGSVERFWERIGELDQEFETRRKILAAQGRKWRFVATMEQGECSVGLEEVDVNSPFYNLEGSNNIVLITTTRYNEYPLQIKGYGAGAGVTAAGVFADIMSIANIR
ncbi:Aspartokinase [Mucinivorans hirudinis]|uniref:Aspartokinase n=1 Tax=Mucinivorans hirudinis TaxID=1433126 RepID=A0A060R896_9BACT|nr:Aspartokinase [Mucinivorans hirudinis]